MASEPKPLSEADEREQRKALASGNRYEITGWDWERVAASAFATLDAERARNDPAADGTDAAHPAWWRGQAHGFDAAVRVLAAALREDPAGTLSHPAGQALREAIAGLRRGRDAAKAYIDALQNRRPPRREAEPMCEYVTRLQRHTGEARAAWLAAKGRDAGES